MTDFHILNRLDGDPAVKEWVLDRYEQGVGLGVFERLAPPNGEEAVAVASEGGERLGFATFWPPYEGERFVWIGQFWVETWCRRQGIGTRLIETIIRQGWPPPLRLGFGVMQGNLAMHALAAKAGFPAYAIQYMREFK